MALGLLLSRVPSRRWKPMIIPDFLVKKSCTKELNYFSTVLSEEQNREMILCLLVYVSVFKAEK